MDRLIHVTTVPQTLGFLAGQIRFMHASGFCVDAVTSPPEGTETPEVEREFSVVHRVRMLRAMSPVQDLVALCRLAVLFAATRPALVDAHTPKAGLLAMLASAWVGVPARVYHLHGLVFETSVGWRRILLKTTERIAALSSTRVLAVSTSVGKVAVRERIVAAKKLRVLLGGSINGIDVQKFSPALRTPARIRAIREKLGIGADEFVVGFVGRLVKDKGIEDLLRAWVPLAQIPKWRLMVIGVIEERDPIDEHAKQALSSAPGVLWLGGRTDMQDLYSVMDLVVLPSYREGLPYVPLETAAMGLPIVATRVTGCVDVVCDGQTGTLVPAGDVEALRHAISKYGSSAELREVHGLAARSLVCERFQQTAIWAAILGDYRQLLEAAGLACKIV